MKKICVFLSVLLLLTAVIPTAGVAAGQKMLYSGTLGSCEWDIDQNWVLTIHEGSFTGDDLIAQNPWPSFSSGAKVSGNVPFRENVKRITTDGAVSVRGSLRNAFSNFLTVKYADLSGFDTGNVTDMNGMFRYCTALESLDIRNFDLSNISDLIETFYKCDALKDINVTNVDEHGRAIIRSALPGKVAFITGNTPDPFPAPAAETPEPDQNKPALSAGNTSFVYDQLQLILEFLKIRNLEGYASSTPGYYAVTDLDHNGRLELLEAVGYSTKDVANLAHLEAYEVNESKTGLVSTGAGLYGNYSLLLEDGNPLVGDACYPDFEPQKGPTKLNVYSEDGIWYYACSTYNVAGGKDVEEIKEWMYLDNGTLCIYPAAWRYFPSGSRSPYFFGSENNQITEKEYNNWKTARFDSEKHTATIWWFTLLNGNTGLSFLENSYEAYLNNKIQSAGVNSASSDIPDYKDYTSSGNTRPGNPAGIIPPIYINPLPGTPAGNGNNSAGQTQAGTANNAPPAASQSTAPKATPPVSVSDTSTSQGNDHSIPNPGPLPNSPSADKQNALSRNIYREALEERFGKDGLPKKAHAFLFDYDGDGVKDLFIIFESDTETNKYGEPEVRGVVYRHHEGKAEKVGEIADLLRWNYPFPNEEVEFGIAEYEGRTVLFIKGYDDTDIYHCWDFQDGKLKPINDYNGINHTKLRIIQSVYVSRKQNEKMQSQRSLEEVLKEADDVTNLISTKAKENDVKTGSNTENASAPGTDATVTKPDISAIATEQIASAKSPAGLPDKEKRDYSDNTSNSGAETWNAPVIYSNPYEQPKGTEDDPWGTAGAVYSIDPISGEIVVTYPDGENDETNGFEYPDPFWEPVFGDFNDSGESVDGSDETPDAETGYGNSILDYLFSLAG